MTLRSRGPSRMPLGRLLLRAFPAPFRRRHGEALLQNAADLLDQARHRGLSLPRTWLALATDLLSAGLAERLTRTPSLPETGRAPMLDTLMQDVRFSIRSLLRQPAMTAVAVATLALGIGASAAMFTVLDGVLLKPLPYPDPEQIVTVYPTIPEWREQAALAPYAGYGRWSFDEFQAWKQRQTIFTAAALVADSSGNLTGLDEARVIPMGRAGVGLFEMLGAVPLRGRFFRDDDAEADKRLAVLSYTFWQNVLGGSEDALGETLTLSGIPHTVVGILPDGFQVSRIEADVWIPVLDGDPGDFGWSNTGTNEHFLDVLARMKPGVDLAVAAQESGRVLSSVVDEEHFSRHGGNVVPRLEVETESARQPLTLLMAGAGLMLLVACANVATLLLGRAVDRQQEIAIRGAVGAGTGRLARQLLTESLLLAMLGGAAGTALAAAGVRALSALAPPDLPRMDSVAVDPRALAFAFAVAVVSGLLFGTAPALSLARTDLARTMGSARFGSSGDSRLQGMVVVGEVALAVVLLVGAGLLLRSFLLVNAVHPGFEGNGVLTVGTSPQLSAYRDAEGNLDAAAVATFYEGILDELTALPGVRAAAQAQIVPFSGRMANNGIVPEGWEAEGEESFVLGQRRMVTAGYVELMNIPLLQGRTLQPDDDRAASASVVMVSDAIARSFWPGDTAVGKKLFWWGQESEVVGVVGDVRDHDLAATPEYAFYVPAGKWGQPLGSILLRVDGDPAAAAPAVRATIARLAPDLPITSMVTMPERIATSLSAAGYRTRLISLFATISATLSLIGLYGVTARSVAARTRELGIRCALGAGTKRLLGMVLAGGLRRAAAGVLIGLAGSLALTGLLETFLYGVAPRDPLTLAAIGAAVLLFALAAVLAPALRAARVDPLVAMRGD